MPNLVTNTLIIIGKEEQVSILLNFIKGEVDEDGEEMFIDFNKIVPMPEELNITISSWGSLAQLLLFGKQLSLFGSHANDASLSIEEAQKRFSKLNETDKQEAVKLGRQYQSNKEKYGHTDWFGWRNENWGTKWNAYSQKKISDNVLIFTTAWDGVPDLINKLSLKFPDIFLDYEWDADECGGHGTYKNGEIEYKTHKKI